MMRSHHAMSAGEALASLHLDVEGSCLRCCSRQACGAHEAHVDEDEHTSLMAGAIAYLVPLAGLSLSMLIAAALNAPDGLIVLASVCGMTSGFLVGRSLARQAALPPLPRRLSPIPGAPRCQSSLPENFR